MPRCFPNDISSNDVCSPWRWVMRRMAQPSPPAVVSGVEPLTSHGFARRLGEVARSSHFPTSEEDMNTPPATITSKDVTRARKEIRGPEIGPALNRDALLQRV